MKNIFKITAVLLTAAQLSFSQTDSVKTTLNEVLVSATKTATPYYAIGSSVSVVTSEVIQQKQLKTVVDILRDLPGISVAQQGGPGKLTYVTMRGANSNHTLVILDGVEMNDPSSPNNAFDFSSLNAKEIDRIEVVRGPQSTLYGSDAVAGVINIITKRGAGRPQFGFEAEGGANNYYRSSLSALGSYGKLSYAVVASQSGSDGVSAANSIYGNNEKDGFSNSAFSSRLDLDIDSNWKLGFIYKYLKANVDLDQNEKLGDDPNNTYKQEEHIWKANIAALSFNGIWQQNLSATYIRRFTNSLDLVDPAHLSTSSDAFNNASRVKIDWQNNISAIPNNLITFGLETELESATTSYFSNSAWGPFDSVFPRESMRSTGFYLQDQMNVDNSLFATFGFRYDENQKFGSIATFRIAPAYYIAATNTKIKATYGNGFKAPSLFYLFDPAFGNPDLKPEKSKGWDLGFEQSFSGQKFFVSVTYFNLSLTDMFGFDSNFRTINIAKAKTSGAEITGTAKINNNLSFNANYTFTETKDESELSTDFGQQLLRRPKHQLTLNANYKMIESLNLNLSIRYMGKREDKDFGAYPVQRVVMPDYLLINFALSYQLFDNLALSARVENLFDKKYEEVLFYGTLGRSLYAGLNLTL